MLDTLERLSRLTVELIIAFRLSNNTVINGDGGCKQ